MTTRKVIYVPDMPLPPVRRRRSVLPVAFIGGAVLVAFYEVGKNAEKPVAATPTPAPKVKIITQTHTIIRTVAGHPALSGAEVVWIVVIVCVALVLLVVGGLSVAARLRR